MRISTRVRNYYLSLFLLIVSLGKYWGLRRPEKTVMAVKARVDTIAVLLRHGLDVDEVCCLETGYAPPFASAMDVINNAGNVLDNILTGSTDRSMLLIFSSKFAHGNTRVLDVRGEKDAAPFRKNTVLGG